MLRVACVLRTTDVHPELFGLSVHSSHTRARISIKRGCVVPFAVIVAILMVVMVVMMVMMVMLVMMILTCRVLRSTDVHPVFLDLFLNRADTGASVKHKLLPLIVRPISYLTPCVAYLIPRISHP